MKVDKWIHTLGTVASLFVRIECFTPAAQWTRALRSNKNNVFRLTAQKADATARATLTDKTTWNLRMVLRGVATDKGKKIDEIFNLKCKFMEEEGYEPPQGIVQLAEESEQSRFQIVKSRWQLSEDPNDRKDGLWVWGLFKEPLYPFLLLQLETKPIPIAGGGSANEREDKVYEGDAIKPLQLYAQLNHRRDADKGVVLTASDLKVRQIETVDADMFGVAKVNLYEEVNIGTLSVQPVLG
ncbi:hypothetical protein ACA910_005917 [Epithemia clementina (nom. ined.)]